MVAIVDYDAGNIKSVEKAVKLLGSNPIVTRDAETIYHADHVILPGVGSFGDAMGKIEQYGLREIINETVSRKIPFLGICLGLQLLFEASEESPGVNGLGIIKGKICRIPAEHGLKIPHIGWNSLNYPASGKLFHDVPEGAYVYFVHSYYLEAADPSIVKATTEYGVSIQASVEYENIFACQFHPEKSSDTGLKILDNFLHI